VPFGNNDLLAYQIVSDIAIKGGNVYAQTSRYNYSPLWFWLLGIMKNINLQFPFLPFHFIVRAFLSSIDLITVVFLALAAKKKNIPLLRTVSFFYLNPISFLLTGYHGQFENLSMLMIVIGIYLYFAHRKNFLFKKIILWLFVTLGMMIKHNVFYEVIICLNATIRKNWIKILLFVISIISFLLLFIPYWEKGSEGILANVFGYSSQENEYGITTLFSFPLLKYLFITGLCLFPFFIKSRDLIRQCLLGVLFFLTFTTGIGIQYFTLPIALGALRPSRGFLFYSLLASIYIIGSPYNLSVPGFNYLQLNVAWLGALYWFLTEQYDILIKPKYNRAFLKYKYQRFIRPFIKSVIK
jgi:hypothetical protein